MEEKPTERGEYRDMRDMQRVSADSDSLSFQDTQ